MPLKTSNEMHFHGADGVHGSVDPGTGVLSLYWGESKLHATPAGAIDSCIKSIAPFLLPGGGSSAPQSRDIELLADNLDLSDDVLEAAIARYLNPDDPQFNKLTYRGIALVGFDVDTYSNSATPITENSVKTSLEASMNSWHNSVGYHVKKHKLAEIGIELFCVPFPSVEEFRQAFLTELGIG